MAPTMNVSSLEEQLMAMKAELQAYKDDANTFVDVFFLLILGLVIFLMQAGFAFLEAGAVRSRNTVNILIKNALDAFFGGLFYWLLGYAFAYGGGNAFIGLEYFALSNLPHTRMAHWFFQYVFAATATTIVSGALAERCDFRAYIIYSSVVTGFVYPVATHWAWSADGWLLKGGSYDINGETLDIGYNDFSGSVVVHVLGGIIAFVGAFLLGPRIGRFDQNGRPLDIRGHSVPFAALGGFILVFGFFAFNVAANGSITNPGDAETVSLAVTNTVLAGSGGAFTTLLMNKTRYFGDKKWNYLTTLNGCLSGMVAICAGCNDLQPYMGFIVGVLGGLGYMLTSWLVVKVKVDDPLDATAVHFGGGVVGILAVPLLSYTHGVVYFWDRRAAYYLAWNILGLVAISAWTTVLAFVLFIPMKMFNFLRVSAEYEVKGLDIPKHGAMAYPEEAYGHGWREQSGASMGDDDRDIESDKVSRNKPCESQEVYTIQDGNEGHVNESFTPSLSSEKL